MSYHHFCVVGPNSVYKTFVLAVTGPDNQSLVLQNYELSEGDRLVDTIPPRKRYHAGDIGFIFPKWDDNTLTWSESATTEEIAEWEANNPNPKILSNEKMKRIQQSKDVLEAYLENHPLTWTDGKQYSITREKQQQLTSKILSATLAAQTSTPYELTWNATGAECTPWTLEELAALAFAIDARVTALVSYQQAKEVVMREAATLEELEGVNVDYDEVS